jgi:hypothetical protein
LRRSARVGQIAGVVHGVTVGNVVLGTRGIAARLAMLNAVGHRNVGSSSTSRKREIQRHFMIILNILFLSILHYKL